MKAGPIGRDCRRRDECQKYYQCVFHMTKSPCGVRNSRSCLQFSIVTMLADEFANARAQDQEKATEKDLRTGKPSYFVPGPGRQLVNCPMSCIQFHRFCEIWKQRNHLVSSAMGEIMCRFLLYLDLSTGISRLISDVRSLTRQLECDCRSPPNWGVAGSSRSVS